MITHDQLFEYEMGFSLVIKAMIEAKKPLIGHNCMYDWIYIYNQFIAPLPETYLDWVLEWNQRFPFTYDTKVLSKNSKLFPKGHLGKLFNACIGEPTFMDELKCGYDLKNHCENYEGEAAESHSHEAAYDAHMTGVVFMHILKHE